MQFTRRIQPKTSQENFFYAKCSYILFHLAMEKGFLSNTDPTHTTSVYVIPWTSAVTIRCISGIPNRSHLIIPIWTGWQLVSIAPRSILCHDLLDYSSTIYGFSIAFYIHSITVHTSIHLLTFIASIIILRFLIVLGSLLHVLGILGSIIVRSLPICHVAAMHSAIKIN